MHQIAYFELIKCKNSPSNSFRKGYTSSSDCVGAQTAAPTCGHFHRSSSYLPIPFIINFSHGCIFTVKRILRHSYGFWGLSRSSPSNCKLSIPPPHPIRPQYTFTSFHYTCEKCRYPNGLVGTRRVLHPPTEKLLATPLPHPQIPFIAKTIYGK